MNLGVSVRNDIALGKMKNIKESGFDCIELSLIEDISLLTEEYISEVCKEVKESGIKIRSLHLPFGDELDISRKSGAADIYIEIIKNFLVTGFEIAVIHLSYEPIDDLDREERIKNVIASVKKIDDFCKKHNVKIAMECLPRTCIGNCSKEMNYIFECVKSDNLGICFDCNHLTKEDNFFFIKNIKEEIFTVHFSDFDGIDEKHWYPGKGVINWKELTDCLLKKGYTGPYVFEVAAVFDYDYISNLNMLRINWNELLN